MLRTIAFSMMLSVALRAQQSQQIDKPSVQDLADKRDAARTEVGAKLGVINGAERILRDKLGSELVDDYKAEAPFIHLRVMACLIKYDYTKLVSQIYADAADAAAKAAKECQAQSATQPTPSSEVVEARQNLDEAIHREAELKSKKTLNGVEKAELDGLPAFENQLRQLIALYDRKPNETGLTPNDMCRPMSEREATLRIMVRRAEMSAKFYKDECQYDLSELREIEQAERRDRQVREFDRLTEGQAAPGAGGKTTAPTAASGLSDADKLKEDERILSDPDEMLRRAEQKKQQLSGQNKLN